LGENWGWRGKGDEGRERGEKGIEGEEMEGKAGTRRRGEGWGKEKEGRGGKGARK